MADLFATIPTAYLLNHFTKSSFIKINHYKKSNGNVGFSFKKEQKREIERIINDRQNLLTSYTMRVENVGKHLYVLPLTLQLIWIQLA
jgi:hypothetical protein